MNVVALVDGREVIPIRAIPYVTGWTMSPDLVVSWLAHTESFRRIPKLSAYHLLPDGKSAPMLPKEWDGISADLEVLSDKLRARETFDQEGYPEWRRNSIPLLPEGVFVWKDEFEGAFARGYSHNRLTILDERPGDRELNFSPLIPQELREIVVDGFSAQLIGKQAIAIPSIVGRWPWGSHHTETLGHLEAAARKWWILYDPDDRGTAPTNETVATWLQDERGISKEKARAIASMLRPDDLPTGPRK